MAALLLFFVLWRVVLYTAVAHTGHKAAHSAVVFVGDSRMNYLYQSPDNYGATAEPIVYTYYKVKYMLSQRKLDTVVLAVGYNSFASYYDEHIKNISIMERYYPYLPDSVQRKYLTKVQHPRVLYDRTIDLLRTGTVVVGAYNAPPRNWYFSKTDCNKRLKEQYEGKVLCTANLQYLDSMRMLCAAHGVQLILLHSPIHPYYEEHVPTTFIATYKQTVAQYLVWNFAHTLNVDTLFLGDGDHVTEKGAEIMTKKIDSLRALAGK